MLGRPWKRSGIWRPFLARRNQDALFDRLTKSRSSTTKFIVQFDIFMHKVIVKCFKYIQSYSIGVHEDMGISDYIITNLTYEFKT